MIRPCTRCIGGQQTLQPEIERYNDKMVLAAATWHCLQCGREDPPTGAELAEYKLRLDTQARAEIVAR